MGRSCRSNRSECVCAIGARWRSYVRGGSIVPCGMSPRLAVGVWWCRLNSCVHTLGRRLPSPVVGRCVDVRVVARVCECLSLVSARAFVSVGLVAPRSALLRLLLGGLHMSARRCVVPWWRLGH